MFGRKEKKSEVAQVAERINVIRAQYQIIRQAVGALRVADVSSRQQNILDSAVKTLREYIVDLMLDFEARGGTVKLEYTEQQEGQLSSSSVDEGKLSLALHEGQEIR